MTTPLPRYAFPAAERWAYLNHAGVCPLPTPAVDAIRRCAEESARDGGLAFRSQTSRAEEVRSAAAHLMGVAADEVAFVKNTTEGLGFVANGLDWQPGDRVVVPDLEFPSTVYPWLALRERGVEVDLVEPVGQARVLPTEAFEAVIRRGPPPKVVAASWVQYGRGWRADLAALAAVAHRHGALLCVDAIQGLGVVPAEFDAWGVDFAAADAHKWLVGPLGTGVLYVRRSRLDLLRPLEPGWSSVAHREEWDNLDLVWDEGARRLEGGSVTMIAVHGMGAALDLLLDAGVETVWPHVTRLCDRAAEGLAEARATVLSDRGPEGRSGIVTFSVDGRGPEVLVEDLQREGIVCAPRGGGVRLSPHGWNDAEDIDRLVAAVAARRR